MNMEIPPTPTPAPAQPKSNTSKIIIIVIAVIAVLCLVACAAIFLLTSKLGGTIAKSVDSDPANVTAAVEKIAVIDVPGGFQPKSSMALLGMTFAFYENASQKSALMIFQMPSFMEMNDTSIQEMEKQLQSQSNRQMQNVKIVDRYDATIRGKPGVVIIQEGEVEGQAFRQMMAVFEGKSGLAMLMIFGPQQGWPQTDYDKMIQSIR